MLSAEVSVYRKAKRLLEASCTGASVEAGKYPKKKRRNRTVMPSVSTRSGLLETERTTMLSNARRWSALSMEKPSERT